MNGIKRRLRDKKHRHKENNALKKVLGWLGSDLRLWLGIEFTSGVGLEYVTLMVSEISTDRNTINSIHKVVISPHDKRYKPIVLTGGRARKLIRKINKMNT